MVGPDLAYNTFAKWFFFDHFCAGRDLDELQVKSMQLARQNVGAILDYAAEAELVLGNDPASQSAAGEFVTPDAVDGRTGLETDEVDGITEKLATDAAKLVEQELPKAAEMMKKAVVHDPSPVDVVEKVYSKKRKAQTRESVQSQQQQQQQGVAGIEVLLPRIDLEVNPVDLERLFVETYGQNAPKPRLFKLPPQHSSAVYFAVKKQLRFTKPQVEMIMNVDRFLTCINNAGELRSYRLPVAYAALKPTALCDTLLLSRLNSVLLGIRKDWLWFSKPDLANITPLQQCRLLLVGKEKQQLDISGLSVAQFKAALLKVGNQATSAPSKTTTTTSSRTLSEKHINLLVQELDPDGDGFIDYLTYTQLAAEALCGFAGSAISDPEYIAQRKTDNPNSTSRSPEQEEQHQQSIRNIFNHIHRGLHQEEIDQLRQFYKRFDDVVQQCVRKQVRIMVDAEQTYYQTAIDHVVRELQRKYNKTEPVVSNTYQAYTEIAAARVTNDIRRATREGWVFAAKIVRGAYMEEERQLAELYKYRSPIWDGAVLTHACYNTIADRLLGLCRENPHIKYGILFGTHNPESVYYISSAVARLPIECKCEIAFAQLLGMADDLTFYLTRHGFKVFKYLPYGPVKETLAYLMRRAQENKSLISQANPSIPMMKQELARRFKKALAKYTLFGFVLWFIYSNCLTKYTVVIREKEVEK